MGDDVEGGAVSASAKLEALDAAINEVRGQPRYVTTDAFSVLNALPEIIAAVEAAEFYLSEYAHGRPALTIGIEQSLAALSNALPDVPVGYAPKQEGDTP